MGALLAIVFCVAMCSGCMDDDINRDRDEVTDKEMGRDNYDIRSVLVGLQGMVIPTQEHLYQFMEAMCGGAYAGYFGETRTGWKEKFSTYNPKVDWARAPFSDVITGTYPNYNQILKKEDNDVALALARLLRVSIMQRLTDMYGPIPYSKVIPANGFEPSGLESPYDSQQEVYTQMFKELDEADQALEANATGGNSGFEKLDDVYYGNLRQWQLYLHSMQLRLAMRLTYTAQAAQAREVAEKAVRAGVIEANKDNALFHVEENRSALCFNDWSDYRVGADIICYMNGYKDPRLPAYFTKVPIGSDDGYVGMRIGINSSYPDERLVSSFSNRLMTSKDPYVWMTAAEVSFLRAEGALRGWAMGGDAKTFYEEGVRLSMEEHGVSGADTYLESTGSPQAYTDPLSESSAGAPGNITVKWNDSSDAGMEENLERVITQKWIALFPNGIEAWSEHRRTGYPRLLPVVVNNDPHVDTNYGIRRLAYPSEEKNLNPENTDAAIGMLIRESDNNQGGDTNGTNVWWDKKPRT
jgi:hypothetical protein